MADEGPSVWESISATCAKWPGATALQYFQSDPCPNLTDDVSGKVLAEVTYSRLREQVEVRRDALLKWKLKPGNRVVLLSENRLEWPLCYFAVHAVGGTVVQLDPVLGRADLKDLIERSDVAACIFSPAAWRKMTALGSSPALIGTDRVVLDLSSPSLEQLTSLSPPAQAGSRHDDDKSIATIIFTSGTTGRPKGVMLSHRNILFAGTSVADRLKLYGGDSNIAVLPLHHIFAFAILVALVQYGACTTFVDVLDSDLTTAPNLPQIMGAAMRTVRPTVVALVPVFYEAMWRKITAGMNELSCPKKSIVGCFRCMYACHCAPGPKLFKAVHARYGGRVRLMLTGGAALSVEVAKGFTNLGFKILPAYGMSETAAVIATNLLDNIKLDSVGLPVSGTEIKISDEGEILYRGPNVMRGYFRDPQETNNTIIDGWIYTGDEGVIDADGYVHITGRIKELIVTDAGKKIAPISVEYKYGLVEGVQEYSVFGRSTGTGTETVHAAVVISKTSFPTGTDLATMQKMIRERFAVAGHGVDAMYKITGISFLDSLPKTAKMSVKRRELDRIVKTREAEEKRLANGPSAAGAPSSPVVKAVIHVIHSLQNKKDTSLTGASDLKYELALDSMSFVQMLVKAGQVHNVDLLPEYKRQFGTIHTIADLAALIESVQQNGPSAPTAMDVVAHRLQLAASGALREGWFPLSGWQKCCYEQEHNSDVQTYIVHKVCKIAGIIDVDLLRLALTLVAEQHVLLRCTIDMVEQQARMVVHPAQGFDKKVFTHETLDFDARPERLGERARALLSRPFAFQSEMPCRALLVSHPTKNEHVFLLVFHHIVVDALSIFIVFHDLFTNYHVLAAGTSASALKADIAASQKLGFQHFSFWEQHLLQAPEGQQLRDLWQSRINLNMKHSGVGMNPTKSLFLNIDCNRRKKIEASGLTACGATLFPILLGAFAVALFIHERQKQPQVVVHSAFSIRNRPEFITAVGPLINELAIPVDLSGNPTVNTILRHAKRMTSETVDTQDYPYHHVVQDRGLSWLERDKNTDAFRMKYFLTYYNYSRLELPGYDTQQLLKGISSSEMTIGALDFSPITLPDLPKPSGGCELYTFVSDQANGSLGLHMRYDSVQIGDLAMKAIATAFDRAIDTICDPSMSDTTLQEVVAHIMRSSTTPSL